MDSILDYREHKTETTHYTNEVQGDGTGLGPMTNKDIVRYDPSTVGSLSVFVCLRFCFFYFRFGIPAQRRLKVFCIINCFCWVFGFQFSFINLFMFLILGILLFGFRYFV